MWTRAARLLTLKLFIQRTVSAPKHKCIVNEVRGAELILSLVRDTSNNQFRRGGKKVKSNSLKLKSPNPHQVLTST